MIAVTLVVESAASTAWDNASERRNGFSNRIALIMSFVTRYHPNADIIPVRDEIENATKGAVLNQVLRWM